MQLSIKYTFKMVIYGAIILALTTFYAVDRVKADSYTVGNISGVLFNENNGAMQQLYNVTSINYHGINFRGWYYSVPADARIGYSVNIIDFADRYLGYNQFTGYVQAALPISSVDLGYGSVICDLSFPTNVIQNGVESNIPNKQFAKITCKGNLTHNMHMSIHVNQGSIHWNATRNHFYGISIIDISEPLEKKVDDTNKKLNDVENTIKDDNIDTDSTANAILVLENSLGLDTNFITSLIILPYNLLTTLYDNASVCTSINLGTLFDSELILPCIDIEDTIGSTLYNLIDVIMCGVCAIGFVNSLKKLLDKILTLSSDIEETADIKIFK